MEVLNYVVELISSVGFPIACSSIMFYLLNKEKDAHAVESKGWQEVVANNTQALEKIAERIIKI